MVRMMLYRLNLSSDAHSKSGSTAAKRVSAEGVVTGRQPNTSQVATDPDLERLDGELRDQFADQMATEMKELSSAEHIQSVPYYGYDSGGNRVHTQRDGYYVIENFDIDPLDQRNDDRSHFEYTGRIRRVGTRQTHFRSIATNPTQVDNDFGNDTTKYVGIPAQATKVRWFNANDKTRESPTKVTTRTGEFGDVDIYDAANTNISGPTMIYDLPYQRDGRTDAKVWDNRGQSKKTSIDSTDVLQWPRVFSASHDFEGIIVVENGIMRLEFDDANNTLSAYSWDNNNSTYSSTSLNASNWELFDTDLRRVGDDRVEAQVEFRDPNQSPTAYFSLNMALPRGYNNALWWVPSNQSGSTPSGLNTKLTPIADTSIYYQQAERDVTSKDTTKK